MRKIIFLALFLILGMPLGYAFTPTSPEAEEALQEILKCAALKEKIGYTPEAALAYCKAIALAEDQPQTVGCGPGGSNLLQFEMGFAYMGSPDDPKLNCTCVTKESWTGDPPSLESSSFHAYVFEESNLESLTDDCNKLESYLPDKNPLITFSYEDDTEEAPYAFGEKTCNVHATGTECNDTIDFQYKIGCKADGAICEIISPPVHTRRCAFQFVFRLIPIEL